MNRPLKSRSVRHSNRKSPLFDALESRTLMSAAPQVMGYLVDYKIGSSGNAVFSENYNGSIAHDNLNWKGLNQVNYFSLLPNASPAYNAANPASTPESKATSNGGLQATTDSGYSASVQLPALVKDAKSHGVNVFVTVGAGDSNAIYDMDALVNTPSAWPTFAAKIKSFCSQYGIAGVDLDWEPTAQAGFTVTKTQIDNFGKLVATIKSSDPGLKLTSDALGDPVELSTSTGADTGTSAFMLNATAVANLNSINVEAYPVPSATAANQIMQAWASYVAGGKKDLDGTVVKGHVSQLQYGLDIDSDDTSNRPAKVIEGKVDTTIASGYGGIFLWELDADTASPSVVSRIATEITKDAGGSTKTGGTVSGSAKTSSGAGVSGVTIYLDANNNGKLDKGEMTTTTGSTGAYSFGNVPAGAYAIRQVFTGGDTQTTPAGGYGIHVTVTNGGNLTNENFTDTVPVNATHELTGTLIGSTNALQSYKSGHGPANVFDNNVTTVFEDTYPNGVWVGLDLGKAHKITQIKYAADPANPYFMEGGIFQASNVADFSSGVVNLYSVPNTSVPSTSLTSVNIGNSSSYRYLRYLPPAGSAGDVAEVDFFGI